VKITSTTQDEDWKVGLMSSARNCFLLWNEVCLKLHLISMYHTKRSIQRSLNASNKKCVSLWFWILSCTQKHYMFNDTLSHSSQHVSVYWAALKLPHLFEMTIQEFICTDWRKHPVTLICSVLFLREEYRLIRSPRCVCLRMRACLSFQLLYRSTDFLHLSTQNI